MRDELSKGRYDPSLAGIAYLTMHEAFKRRLQLGACSSAEMTPQKTPLGCAEC